MSGARSPVAEPVLAGAASRRTTSPSTRGQTQRASSPPPSSTNNNTNSSMSSNRSLSKCGSGSRSPPTTPNSTSSNQNQPQLTKNSHGSEVSSPDLTRGSPSSQQPRPGFPFPPGHPGADPAACDPHLLNLFRLGGAPGGLPFGLFPPPPGTPGGAPPEMRNGPHPPDGPLLPGLRPDQPVNSAFYPPPGATPFNMKENENLWLNTFPYASMFYPPFDGNPALAGYPFGPNGCGMYMGAARRKNATRESTATLRAWLNEHQKNPYPTKGEKIMLAIITQMTLTQVSTWFANARRRMKKNKITWSPRNGCDGDDDDDDSNDHSNQGKKDKDDDDDDIDVDVESDSNPDSNPLLASPSSALNDKTTKSGLPPGFQIPPHLMFHPSAHHHHPSAHPYARPFNGIDSFASAFKGPSAFTPAAMKSLASNGPGSLPNWPAPPLPPASLASSTSSPTSGTHSASIGGSKPRIWSIVDTVKSEPSANPTPTSTPQPPPHSLASSLNASTNALPNSITSPFCRPLGLGSNPFGPNIPSQPVGMGPIGGGSRHLARNGASPR